LICAPGASLSAGGTGSLLGALAPAGDITPPPEIKLNFNFFFITLIAVMFIRGIVILLAIILFKNILLKILGVVLLATDFLLTYGFGFNNDGEARPVSKTDYTLRTIHLFLVVCLVIYFIIYYFFLNLKGAFL
jgi:hypothetical protein